MAPQQRKLHSIVFIFLFACFSCGFIPVQAQEVALVLSGGGARGLAHIGVLKALEENNIPIDYIAGTSMGAIVGALYASGYSPEEIEKIAVSPVLSEWTSGRMDQDYMFFFKSYDPNASWVNLFFDYDKVDEKLESRLPTNLISPNRMDFAILELYASASAAAAYDFDSLFVPFRCVAADIDSNKSFIFRKGPLGSAVRASTTYPFYFKPIEMDGKILFDGGLYNNFPVDVAMAEYNPDIIIGSKTTWNFPNPEEEDIISQVRNMIARETSFELPRDKGIMIEPNVPPINVIDFSRNKELIDSGYAAAMRIMPDLKDKINRRVSQSVVQEKRKAFSARKPQTFIDSISVDGLNKSQTKYVEHLFRKKSAYLTLSSFKKDYFKLLSDNKIKSVFPSLIYHPERGFYELNMKITKAEHFNAEFGGNISSNAASTAYLGLHYNLLTRYGFAVIANGYFGRFYSSANGEFRVDFPGMLPMFLKADITYIHKDYFKNATYFFEDKEPSFLISNENHFNLQYGLPVSNSGVMSLNTAIGYTKDQYYQTNQFTRTDTADLTYFDFLTPGLAFEFNTLNSKQYSNKGYNLQVDFRYINGRERTVPGSTSLTEDQDTIKYHDWFHLRVMYNKYFKITRWFKLGFYGECLISNQDLFSNYTATILRTPAFEPIPEMKTLFLAKYRALDYFGLGIQPVFILFKNFDLRAEGYIFQPYEELEQGEQQQAVKAEPWSDRAYILSGSLVYHMRLTPISLSFNYYNKGEDKFSVMFNIGFIIFNKSVL